ncbi:MAG: type II toxin-antitoxin system RelE/ParE family toxin [Pirellulaceae bacterium]
MRRLAIQKSVIKDLDKLPAKQYRQVASSMLDLLKEPFPHNSKALKHSSYHRLAVGEYRIIYEACDDEVSVLVIGKRNDGEVYRMLKND